MTDKSRRIIDAISDKGDDVGTKLELLDLALLLTGQHFSIELELIRLVIGRR